MSAAIASALRHRCGHDSRSVDGCLDCEAADAIEARPAAATKLCALVLELAEAVDNAHEDIGGSRPQLAASMRERYSLAAARPPIDWLKIAQDAYTITKQPQGTLGSRCFLAGFRWALDPKGPLANAQEAPADATKLATLVLELAEAVDNAAEDIGGSRPQLTILREAVVEARKVKL